MWLGRPSYNTIMLNGKPIRESDCMQIGFYVSANFYNVHNSIRVHDIFQWEIKLILNSHQASGSPAQEMLVSLFLFSCCSSEVPSYTVSVTVTTICLPPVTNSENLRGYEIMNLILTLESSLSPGSLSEMQVLRPRPRPTEWENWGVPPRSLCSETALGHSDECLSSKQLHLNFFQFCEWQENAINYWTMKSKGSSDLLASLRTSSR